MLCKACTKNVGPNFQILKSHVTPMARFQECSFLSILNTCKFCKFTVIIWYIIFQKFWTSICKTLSHIARKSANLEYQHFNTMTSCRNADTIIHMVTFPRAAFVSNAFIFPFIYFIVVTPFTGMTWNCLLRWSKGLHRMWIFFLFPHLPCFFLVCQHESKLGQKDLRW